MNNVLSYGVALLFALLFHGLVIALMSFNWQQPSLHVTDITPYYIEAAVVRENPYRARERLEKDKQRLPRMEGFTFLLRFATRCRLRADLLPTVQ